MPWIGQCCVKRVETLLKRVLILIKIKLITFELKVHIIFFFFLEKNIDSLRKK